MRWPTFRSGVLARHVIGAFVLLLAAGIVGALFLFEIPDGNREVALVVLGVAIGWGANVVNFHFGTSEGSKTKTDIIERRNP